jgi:hypothetical protein
MPNLHIQINQNILDRYKTYGLSLEYLGSVLLILLGLYEEEYELLDSYDDGNKERQVMLLYQYLDRKGLIERSEDDTIYILTETGVDFIKFVKSEYENASAIFETELTNPVTEGLRENAVSKPVTQDVSQWIESWINLFPSGKFQGRYLRTNKTECADRMRWFLKNYGFDKDTIFRATKVYLETQEQSQTGHTYTRNTSYFIFKGRSKHDRTSDLATWCQKVKDDNLSHKEYVERDAV